MGTDRRDERRSAGRNGWRRAAGAATAVVAIGLLLSACTGSPGTSDAAGLVSVGSASSGSASPAGDASFGESQAGSAQAGSAAGSAAAGSAASAASAASPSDETALVSDRQVIRTASVALQVTAPAGENDRSTRTALADATAQAATKVRALAPSTGGYVSASDGHGATISVTLRIPADSYASVMTHLGSIGRVTSRTEKTQDVTDEMIDVASRKASMKASVQRIRELLAKADKIGDVIAIESELEKREADLESLTNREAALRKQVALSTITVTITAVTNATLAETDAQGRHGFLAGLAGGWRAFLAFGTWLASVLGALLPFLPVIAIVVVAGVGITRRRRQQHRPPTSPPTGSGDLP